MKKLILIALPFVIVSLYANNKKIEQINVPKVDLPRVYLQPPQCPSDATSNKTELYASTSEIPPYKHCMKCSMGALLGEEGQEKCSYCGVAAVNYSSSSGE